MADLLAQTGVDDADGHIVIPPVGEREPAAPSPAPHSAAIDPDALPAPHDGPETGELTTQEHTELEVCEAAIDNLRRAFWAAGKALQVIRDGRLYRASHPSFEEYCGDRWEMSRRQADRLIAAWPIAERLRPIGLTLNEGQVRELLPVAARHGDDAAITVYQAVAEVAQVDGGRVTAAVLGEVVRILPADRFDPDEAVEQIRAYFAGLGQEPAAASPVDPVQAWAAERERARETLRKSLTRPAALRVFKQDPEKAREIVADLRALLDEVEQQLIERGSSG